MSPVSPAHRGCRAELACLAVVWLVAVPGCSTGAGNESRQRAGSLDVEWIGSDTGKLSAPAVAEWCDSLRLLEVRAIRGDTGVALALYPPDSVRSAVAVGRGEYRVISPEGADSIRPSAAVALRWFAETSIRGFRGDSGQVVLEAAGRDSAAGRFSARLRSISEGSRLSITGSFQGLTIIPAPGDCAGRHEEPYESDDDGGDDGDATIDTTDMP